MPIGDDCLSSDHTGDSGCFEDASCPGPVKTHDDSDAGKHDNAGTADEKTDSGTTKKLESPDDVKCYDASMQYKCHEYDHETGKKLTTFSGACMEKEEFCPGYVKEEKFEATEDVKIEDLDKDYDPTKTDDSATHIDDST